MDLNVMMREQAKLGLEAQLSTAVTNGDVETATKIADDLAKLAVSTAPKAPPYGDAEVRAQLDKVEWFGIDPKKSAKAIEFGKTMDPKKFGTAEDFAKAIIKAVDEEFKPAAAAGDGNDNETDEEREAREEQERVAAAAGEKKPRRTDGPRDGDTGSGGSGNRSKGPWVKLSDAPADVQKDIKRAADKFVPANAPKERREAYVAKALESHYNIHQQKAGKK